MNATYEWLYDNYAQTLQGELRKMETLAIEQLSENIPLSDEHKVTLADCLAGLRLQCGAESFALGLQLSLRLIEGAAVFAPTAS